MTALSTRTFTSLMAAAKKAAKAKHFHEAIDLLENAHRIQPADRSLYILKAEAYKSIGDFASAAEEIDRAIEYSVDDIELLVQRAELALNVSDINTATTSLRRAITLRPELPELWIAFISVVSNSVSSEKAASYIAAIGIDPPQQTNVLIKLAEVEVSAGKFESAERRIRLIFDESKNDPDRRKLYAKFLMEIGEDMEARVIYRELHDEFPNSTEILMAEAFAEQHENSSVPLAIQNYKRVLRVDPANTAAMRQLAECQKRLAQYSSARRSMEQFAALQKKLNAEDVFERGRIEYNLNNKSAAADLLRLADSLFESSIAHDQTSASDFCDINAKRARIAISQNNNGAARTFYGLVKGEWDVSSFHYDEDYYLQNTSKRIDYLRRIIGCRDVMILALGPSIADMPIWLKEFAKIDACIAAVSSFKVLENQILQIINERVHIAFHSHYRGITPQFDHIKEFLKRPDENLFITSRWALDRLGRKLPSRQELEAEFGEKLIYIGGSGGMAGATPFNPLRFVFGNSLSVLIPLMALGGARRIFLFGADGVAEGAAEPSQYFCEESLEIGFDFKDADRQALTGALRADTLDFPEAVETGILSLETLFGFKRPPIFNVSPGSALRPFPIIGYEEALKMFSSENRAP